MTHSFPPRPGHRHPAASRWDTNTSDAARSWALARDFTDLGVLTLEWLRGTIGYQPGRPGHCTITGPRLTALITLVSAGILTTRSQDGTLSTIDGVSWKRRAHVTGFVRDGGMLWRLAELAETHDLTLVASLPGRTPPPQIVTWRDGHPHTNASGTLTIEEIAHRDAWGTCSPSAVRHLQRSVQIAIIDPVIGQNTLWDVLHAGLTAPDWR